MAYVLFNRTQAGTPSILKRYETRKGALIGMRACNRNAGWTRKSMAKCGFFEQEWATNGTDYDYAPYVIANEHHYNKAFGIDQLVPVVSLMSGMTVMIPTRELGTFLDPSTERYCSA